MRFAFDLRHVLLHQLIQQLLGSAFSPLPGCLPPHHICTRSHVAAANLAILSGTSEGAHATVRLASSSTGPRVFVDVVRPLAADDVRWGDGVFEGIPAAVRAVLRDSTPVRQLPALIRGGMFDPYIPTTDGLLIQ